MSDDPSVEVTEPLEPQTEAASDPPAATTATENEIPQAGITFLLESGRRRTMNFEPETTVGRVKELLWNAWPAEWQNERPPGPSYLRVLYLGKILQDEETLTSLKIPLQPAPPTIVHIAIRQQLVNKDEEPIKKKKRRATSDGTPGAGDEATSGGCCGCVIC